MCGIAGIVDRSHLLQVDDVVKKMCEIMSFRGPDSSGFFSVQEQEANISLGMVRLSILDLTKGDQPFYSPNNHAVVFQNGEIYNYRELRDELKKEGFPFYTDCDTEVISVGYQRWGIDKLVRKLDGMFAISIFDTVEKKLFLIRDRFGEKPLYYTYHNSIFAYSSNLKSFKALYKKSDFVIDPLSLYRYLQLHYVPGVKSIFNNILKVLPGYYLSVNLESLNIQNIQYYNLIEETNLRKEEDLEEMLFQSVKSRMISDVPVGIFLSGGLDSSIIAGLASRINPNIMTFSMGFSNESQDESKYAEIISQKFSTTHHTFKFTENSFLSLLEETIPFLDEPLGDQALLPTFWLSREAKKYVKVVLSGEGADEIFGGYSYYSSFLSQNVIDWKYITNEYVTPSGFPLVIGSRAAYNLFTNQIPIFDIWEQEQLQIINSRLTDSLQQACYTDIATWLCDDLLVKFDRMTMANSIEGRAPFLHPDIVKLGLFLPVHEKLGEHLSKISLRSQFKHLLPPSICNRKKQGFVLPMDEWTKSWFTSINLKEYIEETNFPLLDKKKLNSLLYINSTSSPTNQRFLFSMICLLEWYRSF